MPNVQLHNSLAVPDHNRAQPMNRSSLSLASAENVLLNADKSDVKPNPSPTQPANPVITEVINEIEIKPETEIQIETVATEKIEVKEGKLVSLSPAHVPTPVDCVIEVPKDPLLSSPERQRSQSECTPSNIEPTVIQLPPGSTEKTVKEPDTVSQASVTTDDGDGKQEER